MTSRTLSLVTEPAQHQERIVFASSDRQTVDQHFGSAVRFLVYTHMNSHWQLTDVIEFTPGTSGHSDAKLEERISALKGCQWLYCNEVGPSAIRQLLAANIHPIKVSKDTLIEPLLKAAIPIKKTISVNELNQQQFQSLLDEEWE